MNLHVIKSLYLAIVSIIWCIVHKIYENMYEITLQKNIHYNVLIVQQGQIGDYVLTIPLLSALKNYYGKKLNISIIGDSINEKLFKDNENIKDVYLYNSKKYSKKYSPYKYIFPRKSLNEKIIDLAIWLRGDAKTLLWLMYNRIPMRSIVKYPNPLRLNWLTLILKRSIHKNYKHFVQTLGEIDPNLDQRYFSPQKNITVSKNRFSKIFIHISSGNSLRSWPSERFITLINLLLNSNNYFIIDIIGSKSDYKSAENIISSVCLLSNENIINNHCGKYNVDELEKVFVNGDLFIGFDSGPMHIASLVGVPIVALMGPQSPLLFGPWGNQEKKIIYKQLSDSK